MSAEPALRLLPADGVVPDDAPATYAEALVQLAERTEELEGAVARAKRLVQENEHLTTAVGKAHGQVQRLKSERNKELRLHKDYATVERLWAKYRESHPRCREDVPDDWLKLGLERLKDYDEAALSRALDGARVNAPRSDDGKTTYDKWDNVFRTTGHVLRYIERADQAEGKAHRERERHPEVARVLAAVGVGSLKDLENRCDHCGELMILHPGFASLRGAEPCEDPDDIHFRADRWIAEREGRR